MLRSLMIVCFKLFMNSTIFCFSVGSNSYSPPRLSWSIKAFKDNLTRFSECSFAPTGTSTYSIDNRSPSPLEPFPGVVKASTPYVFSASESIASVLASPFFYSSAGAGSAEACYSSFYSTLADSSLTESFSSFSSFYF